MFQLQWLVTVAMLVVAAGHVLADEAPTTQKTGQESKPEEMAHQFAERHSDHEGFRFGREVNADSSGEHAADAGDAEKRYMRFGKRHVDSDHGDEKRYMRFGKRSDEDDASSHEEDKRYMRFGKRYMRFGKRHGEEQSLEKRYMRFGKRDGAQSDESSHGGHHSAGSASDEKGEAKRYMRFGKRYMRFGK